METRSINRTVPASLLALFLVTGTHADDCMTTAASQQAINACAQQAYEAADTHMNEQLEAAARRLGDNSDSQIRLHEATQTWRAFRDAECAFAVSATAGGSAYTMAYNMCRTDLTQLRSALLQGYLNCPEGDISCPLPPEN